MGLSRRHRRKPGRPPFPRQPGAAKVGAGAVVQLGALLDGKVSLVAYCSPEAIEAGQAAGKLIGGLTARLGGKGGGKPDYAQGGGGDASKLVEVLKL